MTRILTVDRSKCVKCGTCADVCPVKIIEFKPGDYPQPVVWAKKACINCGHCVSVCPKAALTHVNIPVESCPPIVDSLNVSLEQVEQYFRSRRSVRNYKDVPVDKGTLEKLIDLAGYAPTGHNAQNVQWRVFSDPKALKELTQGVIDWMRKSAAEDAPISKALNMKGVLMGVDAGVDLILRGAPCLVMTHGHKDDRIAPGSSMIALSHLELAAKAYGLAGCWAGFLDLAINFYEPIRACLDLPEGHVSFASMMFGYPKYKYYRIPLRKKPSISWR
jgi:nitroreductase/NAD-dependent dihydropyrimidine dehydrogenase PreA subunit